MFERDDLQSVIIKSTIAYSLIILGIIFFTVKDYKPYVLGFLFGTIISILGFKLIAATANRAVKMGPSRAYKYTLTHYFLRYFIYALVLFIAAVADYINFPLTAMGLISVKLVIHIYALIEGIRFKKGR